MRVIVYVDGLNLYYNVLKRTKLKWLDLSKLFLAIRQKDAVISIRYFTADFEGSKGANQSLYLRALSSTPLVKIERGRFRKEKQECQVPRTHCLAAMRDFYATKEKQTDVGIAVAMVEDAANDRMDAAIVISGDSDLIPGVRAVKRFGKTTILYVPYRENKLGQYARELRDEVDDPRHLPSVMLSHCQFPNTVITPAGQVTKPSNW